MRLLEANRRSKAQLMGEEPSFCVVSLGIQPVLSLAHKYGLEPEEAAQRIAGLFLYLGADKVTSVTVAENMSLVESQREFLRIYEKSKIPELSKSATGLFPILTGICPGWVCYAEKLHGQSLPYISGVKSAQQIMGSLVKLLFAPRQNLTPDQITHITLMSCFDRKLEASRTDFQLPDYRTKEVDNVITPVEMEQILGTLGKTLIEFPPVPLDSLLGEAKSGLGLSLMSHHGSGSGGYAEYVLRSMHQHLFGTQLQTVVWKQGRNPDIWDSFVSDGDGKPVLRFSIATGFRNIQTIVRKLKTKGMAAMLPHYIEIMACPTGCLNGGAQCRTSEGEGLEARDLSGKLEGDYHALERVQDEERAVGELYDMLGSPDAELYQRVLYTQFHAVEKTVGLGLGVKW